MQLNFDARTVAPDVGFEVIPAGWYNAMVDQSEMKPTNDGQGQFLELRYTILDGAHKGTKQFSRLNIRNNNEKAVEIAWRQLSAVCHAIGVLQLNDTQQLHAIPLKIKVGLRKGGPKLDKDTKQPTGEVYDDSNEVKGWKNINEPTNESVPAAAGPQTNMGFQPQQQVQQPQQGWGAPAPAQAPPTSWGQAQAPQQQPVQQPWGGQQAAPAQPPVQQAAPPWGGPAQTQQPPQAAPQQPWGQPAQQQPAAAPQQAPWGGQPPQNGGTVQQQQPQAPQQAPMQAPPWTQR